MLSYLKGDLLSSPAQVQVNTVNTVGVMGKGIALQFKNKYPKMFLDYQQACNENKFDVGNLFLWKSEMKWILMFPTKKEWKNPSKIEYVEEGLKKFVINYDKLGIESIAFPKLGCGNGKLDWKDVKPLMEKYLKPLPITVYIYVDGYTEMFPQKKEGLNCQEHSKFKNLNFDALKKDIKETLTYNNNILYSDGLLKHIEWNDNRIVIQNGNTIEIEESQLCDFWDYIKNVGVIEVKKIPEMFSEFSTVMLQVFERLHYIQPVLIAKNEEYLNEGAGYQCVVAS